MAGGNTIEKLPTSKDANRVALDRARTAIGGIILGKDAQIALALSCLLARGHLLIEDLPGLGKTILAQALAHVLGLSYRRIQFTSDLLPADIVGVSVFQQSTGEFKFQPGPIFAQLILADEVNRATPKAQSALLEAMEENQVSVDGNTRPLPDPFFVVATQNPSDQIGTFPLPESQLDRFLMRLALGYPNAENERELIIGEDRRSMLEKVKPAVTPETLTTLQKAAATVHMSDPIVDYIQELVRQTRESPDIDIGLSPRGALALAAAAKAHAFVEHHSGVFPDDIQAVFAAVAGHRLKPAGNTSFRSAAELCQHVLDTVAIP
ncbi:MAG: AAA family ATPase [Gammaproteobacteria bacterium]|nr:MAG: AAA family ATPase [Gammaproteobacteria bacterium]